MTLQLTSGNKITWTFVVMDVSYNIIGIVDLMQHFAFTLDLQRKCLLDKEVQYISNIIQKCCLIPDVPKVFLVENDYLKILADYPKLTQPFHHTSMLKDDGTKIFHQIKVTDYPCSACAGKLGPEKLEYAKKEIDHLLEAGIVRQSDSPYSSPMHMVPKSAENGATFRLCGDYRQLNKMTIPNVQTLFHRLAGAKVFSKVDLVKAYHQIPIDPESIPLTAIITPFGLFEYLYMPLQCQCHLSTIHG